MESWFNTSTYNTGLCLTALFRKVEGFRSRSDLVGLTGGLYFYMIQFTMTLVVTSGIQWIFNESLGDFGMFGSLLLYVITGLLNFFKKKSGCFFSQFYLLRIIIWGLLLPLLSSFLYNLLYLYGLQYILNKITGALYIG